MYVIIGANGYVGSYMIKNILEKTDESIIAAGKNISINQSERRIQYIECDITHPPDLTTLRAELQDEQALKCIYLAAYHHPDDVKANPELAWDINITALSNTINRLPHFDSLFYISTEMVYGAGKLNHRFKEEERLSPVNLYGVHKQVAESIVLGYGYNVVRLPFMIGPSRLPGKKHFYDTIVETLKAGGSMEMFADAYKSALDFDTAAATVIALMEAYSKNTPGILNISGDEGLTKFEIGVRIAEANCLNSDLIKPIYMASDNKIFKESRANCTLLDNSLVKKTLGLKKLKMKF